MTSDLFFDFKHLEKEHTRRKLDSSKNSVLISKVVWMNFGQAVELHDGKEVTQTHPNEVWLRYTYSTEETWSKVSLLKGRKKTQPKVDIALKCKYPHGHPIKSKKVADLQNMIPYLPNEYRQFYRDLTFLPTTEDTNEDDETL